MSIMSMLVVVGKDLVSTKGRLILRLLAFDLKRDDHCNCKALICIRYGGVALKHCDSQLQILGILVTRL